MIGNNDFCILLEHITAFIIGFPIDRNKFDCSLWNTVIFKIIQGYTETERATLSELLNQPEFQKAVALVSAKCNLRKQPETMIEFGERVRPIHTPVP